MKFLERRRNFFIFSSWEKKVLHFDVQFTQYIRQHRLVEQVPNDKELIVSKKEWAQERKVYVRNQGMVIRY